MSNKVQVTGDTKSVFWYYSIVFRYSVIVHVTGHSYLKEQK